MRPRDVVPAALSVVLLLGAGGCMGAFGGGPLDGADVSPSAPVAPPSPSGTPATGADVEAAPGPSPSFVWTEGGESPPPYLLELAGSLSESARRGLEVPGFTSREDLFSCGELVLGQGAVEPRSAWDCLAEHRGTGAQLVLVRPTVEGDPVITYYRVGPDVDGLEIFEDPTFDTFGGGSWTHRVCPVDPAGVHRSAVGCPDEELR